MTSASSSIANRGEWFGSTFDGSAPFGPTPRKKNTPGTRRWYSEKSSDVVVTGALGTNRVATRARLGAIRSVRAGSLCVTGLPGVIVTSAVVPAASAIERAVRCTRSWIWVRIAWSKVRIVPTSRASSGMMLLRLPAWKIPSVMMAGAVVRSDCRLTIVCRPSTICEATTIGSIPCQGSAPCVWRPRTRIATVSPAAMNPPGRTAIVPAS